MAAAPTRGAIASGSYSNASQYSPKQEGSEKGQQSPMKDRRARKDDRGVFAEEVHRTCEDILAGKRPANVKNAVIKVAAALAMMQLLIEEGVGIASELKIYHPEFALKEAGGVLDALMSGREHPVWAYIDSIRSERFRPNKAPANLMDKIQQSFAVGILRAFQRASGLGIVGQREAARVTADICQSSGFDVSSDQIRAWNRGSNVARGEINDPDSFADAILGKARKLTAPNLLQDRVLVVGRQYLKKFTGHED
jgi:hypothetical protein